jgi:hypothetical protein
MIEAYVKLAVGLFAGDAPLRVRELAFVTAKMPPHCRRGLEPPWAEDAATNRMRRRA